MKKESLFLDPLKLVGVLTLIELGLSEEYFRKEYSIAKPAVHSVLMKYSTHVMVTQLMLSYLSFSERISG